MAEALLIDGENLSPAHAAAVMAAAPEAAVRRVYGDAARLNGWLAVPGLRAVHAAPGRNAADILLAVEAVDLLHRGGLRDIALATSDGGLVHLAIHLREAGARVTLIAEAKAPAALRAAAHRFVPLPPPPRLGLPPPPPAAQPVAALHARVAEAVGRAGAAGLLLSELNPAVRSLTDVRIASLPERTWRAWLTAGARGGEFEVDPRGPEARVRLARP